MRQRRLTARTKADAHRRHARSSPIDVFQTEPDAWKGVGKLRASRAKSGTTVVASAAVVVFVTVVAGLVGYRAAQILDNTSTALIKGIISSMQYVSINVDVNIRWPAEMVAIGRWFSSINLNIDIIAPECVSGSFNWY